MAVQFNDIHPFYFLMIYVSCVVLHPHDSHNSRRARNERRCPHHSTLSHTHSFTGASFYVIRCWIWCEFVFILGLKRVRRNKKRDIDGREIDEGMLFWGGKLEKKEIKKRKRFFALLLLRKRVVFSEEICWDALESENKRKSIGMILKFRKWIWRALCEWSIGNLKFSVRFFLFANCKNFSLLINLTVSMKAIKHRRNFKSLSQQKKLPRKSIPIQIPMQVAAYLNGFECPVKS